MSLSSVLAAGRQQAEALIDKVDSNECPGGASTPRDVAEPGKGSDMRKVTPPSQRFMAKVSKEPGCWHWAGSIGGTGYGSFRGSGGTVSAHRFAYELWNGPIPAGMDVHHECGVRHCVNPSHLRAVTHAENLTGRSSKPYSAPSRRRRPTALERFEAKVNRQGECWLWTASRTEHGYGRFGVGASRWVMAHRYSYEIHVGPIPDGLVLDHLCGARSCVNPEHLEAVTQRENLMRGDTIIARNAAATECPKGHAYDDENTRVDGRGHRECRTCRRHQRGSR